jgi:predicted Zn-dependent protease with MMP-like domain
MDRESFERLVEEAVSRLPRRFKKHLQNIAVVVEDRPSRDDLGGTRSGGLLLGLYHGVPLQHRGPYYGNVPPDVIVIYKNSIELICRTDKEVKQKVREVVLHEIGHYFGLSEEELRDIEK